jgi:hypothetical protein
MTVGIYTWHDDCKNLANVDLSKITYYSQHAEEEFLMSTHDYKIAVIEFNYCNVDDFINLAEKFIKCDLVLVRSVEANTRIVELIKQFDFDNFVFVVNSIFNFNLSFAKVVPEMTWITHITDFYFGPLRKVLEKQLIPFAPKPYMFDVMYGQSRTHRDFTRQKLLNHNDQFYQTPNFSRPTVDQINQSYNFDRKDLWEDEIVLSTDRDYECSYYGQDMLVTFVIPFKIYNKTAYSLVCETDYSNEFSFFTEKIVKPILARRLFIVISGQHYLKNLQTLGFKTFDTIIDESYDSVEDPETRWTMAIDQAIELGKQNQQSILKKIIPIVLHNFNNLHSLFKENLVVYELELFLLEKGYYKI